MVRPGETEKSLDQTLKIGIFQIEPFIDGKVKFINQFGSKMLGYDSPDEIIGAKFSKFFADTKIFIDWFNSLEKSDAADELEMQCLKKKGEKFPVCVSADIVKREDRGALRIDGLLRDIQKSKEDELEREIVSNINEILVSHLDIRDVYEKVCEELRRKIAWDRVSVTMLELEGTAIVNFLVTKAKKKSAVGEVLGAKDRYPYIGSILEKVVDTGKPVIIWDTLQNIHETDKLFAKDGLRSRLAYPLKSRSKTIGSVNFSYREIDYYKEEHIKLLDKVVPFLAIAIENTKLYIRATKSEQEFQELFKTIDSPWL